MAFCPNCGSQVNGRFCPNCGSDIGATPAAGAGAGTGYPPPPATPLAAPGLTDNVAGALCYLFGFITGIIFLVLSPYNRNRLVRFHAFQSIFATVALFVVEIVLGIFSLMTGMLHMWALMGIVWLVFRLAVFIGWLYMMYATYNNKKIVLPVVGPLAEKQA
ncbi:MAG TPA: hypothetical protein VH351_02500 [Bryobacteraceae bacterium]|jgi:uncharacterized membrane protein|nr:hypothetical protein [Bryobacteraceae bacterium]